MSITRYGIDNAELQCVRPARSLVFGRVLLIPRKRSPVGEVPLGRLLLSEIYHFTELSYLEKGTDSGRASAAGGVGDVVRLYKQRVSCNLNSSMSDYGLLLVWTALSSGGMPSITSPWLVSR
jgi:hypothetical protein